MGNVADGIIENLLGLEDSPSDRLASQLVEEGWKLGGVLRRRRELLGFSCEDVAKKVGTSASSIADAENNPSSVRLRDLFLMCLSLGIELHMSATDYDAAVLREE